LHVTREVVWRPLAVRIDGIDAATIIPAKQTALVHDDGCPGPRYLLVRRARVQAPGGVDLAVDAANCALVSESESGGDLLVAEAARHEARHDLLVRFEER